MKFQENTKIQKCSPTNASIRGVNTELSLYIRLSRLH